MAREVPGHYCRRVMRSHECDYAGRCDFTRSTGVTAYPKNINLPQGICILHSSLVSSVHRMVTSAFEGRDQLKCDDTCAETIFRLSARQTSPFKSAGASVQSTTDIGGVRIIGSNAGYTMFQGSVNSTGYTLHLPVPPSLPPRASLCATTFQLESTINLKLQHH